MDRLLTDESMECIPGTPCVRLEHVERMFPTAKLGFGLVVDPKRGVEWSADHIQFRVILSETLISFTECIAVIDIPPNHNASF